VAGFQTFGRGRICPFANTEALFISTHTVAVHVARVLEKTGSPNRTAAVAYATHHHLLESTRSGAADERRPKK
jgi:hypothetical protein